MKIIAHRGASALAPENTSAAFKKALHLGVYGVELDVQLSKDHIPVVIHDTTLARVAHRNTSIADLTAKELCTIDVGSWFSKDYAKETILTLHQTLDLINASAKVYIEIKGTEETRYELTNEVVSIIEKRRIHDAVELISFSPKTLYQASKTINKRVPLRLLALVGSVFMLPFPALRAQYISGYNFDFFDPIIVKLLSSQGKHLSIGAMPPISPSHLPFLEKFGFEAIMRNDPRAYL